MHKKSRFLAFITFALLGGALFAQAKPAALSDEAAAKTGAIAVFSTYMGFLKKSDYANAARYILPSDLDKFRDILLPFFTQFAASKDESLSEMGKAIIGGGNSLSAQEFFKRFMDFAMENQREVAEIVSKAEITVKNTEFSAKDAAVHISYVMEYGGYSIDADETLIFWRSSWFLALKQDPEDYVAAFSKLLED